MAQDNVAKRADREITEAKPKGRRARKHAKTKGARNLVLLGLISTVIAGLTTGVSLAIYHNSGDIYLDRSRPGFLPDEEEIEQEEKNSSDEEYNLEEGAKITVELLKEYLSELNEEIEAIDAHAHPFDEKVLSDENLGIPSNGVQAGQGEPTGEMPEVNNGQ